MKIQSILYPLLLLCSTCVYADNDHRHADSYQPIGLSLSVLDEAGNDAYGTIQEVISRLYRNPDTDWSQVNLEVLRQHLVDMNDITLNVDVLSQRPIPLGLEIVIQPQTERAAVAMARVLKAHPDMLARESGWRMKVIRGEGQYTLITTTLDPKESDQIRGLGYIGLMAYGDHHQRHHWAMATGHGAQHQHH